MVLPTFIICGTQRGGTTTLYHYLKEHPEICMSEKKEVHYFDLNYHKGPQWYESHFKNCQNKKVKAIGEASPLYMYLREVPERIHETFPDVKLIFILRNPVDRAYSHYWHEVKLGVEYLPFEEAIKRENEIISKSNLFNKQNYSYLDRGKYVIQLERFQKYFSKDQILIIFNEDLKKTPEVAMKKVFEFLKVDTSFEKPSWKHKKYNIGYSPRSWRMQKTIGWFGSHNNILGSIVRTIFQNIRHNKFFNNLLFINGYPPMKVETREELLKYFRPYNKRLEKFLEKKLYEWYK